jgi:undecaprenyl-diphosphatase
VWIIVIGTLPAVVIGYLLEEFFEGLFGKPAWVSVFLLVTAVLLAVSEWLGKKTRELNDLRWHDALLIGLGQAAAIAPGISRSGATIATGLFRGVRREDAARFSFLLATPIIFGAGLFKLLDLFSAPDPLAQVPVLVAGFVAAAICGYLCIWFLLRYLQRGKLYPFSVYCAALGVFCLIVAWLR